MNDSISRLGMIDAIEKYFAGLPIQGRYDMLELVKAQPSTQPRWIPVTERLPEPNKREENGSLRYYLTQNEYGDMMVCSWNGFKWEQIYQLEPTDDEIVAWMSLPKPWKGDANDR